MADFCKECSIDIFGNDNRELANIAKPDEWAMVICEGCGPTYVDHNGMCTVVDCLKEHRKE